MTEIVPRDLICIQNPKWSKYFFPFVLSHFWGSSFKMARNLKVWGHFDVWGHFGVWGHFWVWGHFGVWGHFEAQTPKWLKTKGKKYLGHFEFWMHIKSRGPISVTAVLGHFGVYLVSVRILVREAQSPVFRDESWKRLRISIEDKTTSDLTPYFKSVAIFIHKGKSIILHHFIGQIFSRP